MLREVLCAATIVTATPVLAMAQAFAPERIIDAATGDWNKDDNQDLALLVGPEDGGQDIGIYIYVRDKDHPLLKLVTQAPAKIWGTSTLDGFFGQEPSITALPSGSIAVTSQNSSIGRDRWEQTLTLAYRNGDFVVAGYTYTSYDTLKPDDGMKCDYNVLTGKVKRNDVASKVAPRFVTIQDWTDDTGPGPCKINN